MQNVVSRDTFAFPLPDAAVAADADTEFPLRQMPNGPTESGETERFSSLCRSRVTHLCRNQSYHSQAYHPKILYRATATALIVTFPA